MSDQSLEENSSPQAVCISCGRQMKPHCPMCGSYRCYGLASRKDTVTRGDGRVDTLRVFRCIPCANIYNDDDWRLRCNALPQRMGRPAKTHEADNVVSNRHVPDFADMPDQMKLAVEQLKKKRGIA